MVAAAEFVYIPVLGSHDCLLAWSAISRLLPIGADCAAAGVFAFANFVSQRQPWGDGLDGQSQSSLRCTEPGAAFPHGSERFSGLRDCCCWPKPLLVYGLRCIG